MRKMTARLSPLGFAGVAAALALSAPLRGQEQPAPVTPPPAAPVLDQSAAETLDTGTDRNARMTVPVNIAGHGPYAFIVDTGSERTVLSRELASDLALGPGQTATVHSMTEVSQIPTVVVQGLRVGQRTMVNGCDSPMET